MSTTDLTVVPELWTIGHSTRSIDEFVDLLQVHGIERVADIRTIPRSRRNPQFNLDVLPEHLARAGIQYVHLSALGGLRRARKDSNNTGWRNSSFRGFADYMQTPDFAHALSALAQTALHERLALMCAEAVPWRCHRSLVADALVVRGASVWHITSRSRAAAHRLTSFAHVEGGNLTYPPPDAPMTDEE